MSYTICYMSKTNPDLTEKEIQEIFEQTSKNNNSAGIRGILLHGLGNFFQVLEGDKEVIVPLYSEKIMNDSRHTEVFEIMNRTTQMAVFSNYNSNFNIVKTNQQLEDIKKYCGRHMLESTTSHKLYRLLQPFII